LQGHSVQSDPGLAGRKVSHYQIVEKVAAGGMGVVYKAHDLHLDRVVAIKVLPADRVADPERKRRFILEARAASALNHPNIITVHDVASEDSLDFIVMEFVAGKPLDQMIGGKGLKLADVLKYGTQIADALASAHATGIVHRDLKPGNVMVTENGLVKVLDFGLAKLTGAGPPTPTQATKQTQEGMIVGTVGYMSPEQVRGQVADHRGDVFAFGALLYEMLTGRCAFQRPSAAETMRAILNEDPPAVSRLIPNVPSGLQRVVQRCLEKNPDRRFQSAVDLAFALEALSDPASAPALSEHPPAALFIGATRKRKAFFVSLAVGLIGIALAAIVLWQERNDRVPLKRFQLVPITTYPGQEIQPSLSPDGTQVAFAWNGTTQGKFHIFVKAVGAGPPLQLTRGDTNDIAPAWSPDGSSIAFLRELSSGRFAVFLIPPLGGSERQLTEISIPEFIWMPGPYLSWSPDSRSLAIPDRPTPDRPTAIFLFSIQSGEKRQMTFPPPNILGDSCVALSPDAHHLAFCRSSHMGAWLNDIYAATLDLQLRPITDPKPAVPWHPLHVNGIAWNGAGTEIVFAAARQQGFDLGLWRVPATNPSAAPALEMEIGTANWPSAARLSSRMAFARATGGGLNISRLPISGAGKAHGPPNPLIESTRQDFAPRYSPDGKRIAFESDRTGNLEIWSCNSDGQDCHQVTAIGSEFTGYPSWSPDGKQIAFYSRVNDKSQIFVIGADGTGLRQLTFGDSNPFVPMWSRDGQWIYFSSSATRPVQIWKISTRGGIPVQVTRNGGFAAFESPDGTWLYYTKTQAADTSLWKVAVTGGEEVRVLPSVHICNVSLVPEGIYFREGPTALKFCDHAGRVSTVANLPPGYVGLSVSPDRKWIVFTVAKPQTSELIIIENFQ
jgi:serine/threonine protein kinase